LLAAQADAAGAGCLDVLVPVRLQAEFPFREPARHEAWLAPLPLRNHGYHGLLSHDAAQSQEGGAVSVRERGHRHGEIRHQMRGQLPVPPPGLPPGSRDRIVHRVTLTTRTHSDQLWLSGIGSQARDPASRTTTAAGEPQVTPMPHFGTHRSSAPTESSTRHRRPSGTSPARASCARHGKQGGPTPAHRPTLCATTAELAPCCRTGHRRPPPWRAMS